ncbi:MAG: recombinase family protein [Lachnospiraceae bacterium]|jgi:site-specific recombinase, resolvase family|nr:recombinase family protein [Lachnospiraceae bacterium]MEE1009610.1 recombinase family protein [Agathobacter sp.]
MARKSRIAENAMSIISAKEGAYKTAVYARLSTEDLDEDTLDNQIYLLKSFVGEKTDMVLVDIYADNGFSGTNFERPEFTRLMNDVKTGKVNCIVVKDLSRLGRNYIETGNLIENVFPFLNVRFIAVTDNFDTNEGGGVENMVASFKNLVNDVYAKDISRKIITAFRTKQKNGEYIGLVAPYGYLKSAENKNKFVIDEKTAPAVKKIFELYAGGYGLDRIARIMNESDYDCPRKYRYSIGITKSDRYKNSKWGRTTINTILTNRAYIGDMVQGKVKQELCNNIVMHYTNKDDWIVVEGTHEAIIERNLFFEVQDILEKKKTEQAVRRKNSKSREYKEENLLKGRIKCGCCGKSMNLAQNVRGNSISRSYYCSGYKELREAVCTNKNRINKSSVESKVLESIKKCIFNNIDESSLSLEIADKNTQDIKKRMVQIERAIRQTNSKIADLYKDVSDGLIDENDYLLMKTKFLNDKKQLEREEKLLSDNMKKTSDSAGKLRAADYLKKCKKAKKLDRKMVESFIELVTINDDKSIEITFSCCDEILRKLEG